MKNVLIPGCKQRSLAFYLGVEEYVASVFDEDAFFVWQSAPAVIIGRNQDLEAEVNLDFCRKHSVRVYRRKSGGGCVYSDFGNIMISYISRRGEVAVVFDRYLSALTASLRKLGFDAVRSGRNDILVEGRKVSGNAFQQLPGKSIVHGTLLVSTDMDAMEQAIRPPLEKLIRHGVPSVRQRVANLSDMPGCLPVSEMMDYLVAEFCDGELQLDAEDVSRIEEIESGYMLCNDTND